MQTFCDREINGKNTNKCAVLPHNLFIYMVKQNIILNIQNSLEKEETS